MRRALTVVAMTAAIAALPGAALADGDVAELLQEVSEAQYRGSGIVMCSWGADSAAATYEVSRGEGTAMVEGPGGASVSHDGVSAIRSGADWYGTEVEEWAAWEVSDRYRMGERVETSRLGRPAVAVAILENGLPRVRMVLDAATGVPLLTEVLDGEGRVFRTAALMTFTPGGGEMPGDMPPMDDMETETVHPMAATTTLPALLAGYVRADVYDAGGGAVHAFYTDGVFSFSVFEAPRAPRPAAFEAATEFRAGNGTYRRIVAPTGMWVQWNAPDRSYVMVGDLPPDHLLAVLDRLPAPGERGWLVRMWRALFG